MYRKTGQTPLGPLEKNGHEIQQITGSAYGAHGVKY